MINAKYENAICTGQLRQASARRLKSRFAVVRQGEREFVIAELNGVIQELEMTGVEDLNDVLAKEELDNVDLKRSIRDGIEPFGESSEMATVASLSALLAVATIDSNAKILDPPRKDWREDRDGIVTCLRWVATRTEGTERTSLVIVRFVNGRVRAIESEE